VGVSGIFVSSHGGRKGVTGVINVLRNELEMAMACVGRPTIAGIDRSVVAGRLDFPNALGFGRIS
jgi:isopentenyl diphosphate isomerase/L-lactate dehydrogenase-like FMN-dependent dehydrogenase